MEQKQKDIWLYSNPDTLKRRVIRYLPEGFEQYLFLRTRKNILNPQGKLHFLDPFFTVSLEDLIH